MIGQKNEIHSQANFPKAIEVRGARENNLKNIDIDIPLNTRIVICGVSGSGKSSLATDTLYAEGSRRYLAALSAYTRRRIEQSNRADVDNIRYLPSALALRQRPTVPTIRSTVGTLTEALNGLRLIFSRLGSHVCPNHHRVEPTLSVAQTGKITCSICHTTFNAPGAEDFSFNSAGACTACNGTGEARTIDETVLIADPHKTIREGAVAGWRVPGSFFYPLAAEALGIPLDVPYRDLLPEQKEIILHGESRKVFLQSLPKGDKFFDINATFLNAGDAVIHAYEHTDSEKSRSRLNRFFHMGRCPACHGSRFAPRALESQVAGKNIAEVSAMPLDVLQKYAAEITGTLPKEMRPLSQQLTAEFQDRIAPLLAFGVDYLTLGRAGNSLSTGELQRIQLARTLKAETTGVLYILDEPSIGLHPANLEGLFQVLDSLWKQGNSVIVVDHDISILQQADWLIEIGPGAGEAGGMVVDSGPTAQILKNERSIIAPYLSGAAPLLAREQCPQEQLFEKGKIHIEIGDLYTLHNLSADFPLGRMTAVTGVSGSGKTALVLDSLIPALTANLKNQPLPNHVRALDSTGIRRVTSVDAVPVGKNVRSTVATYSGIFDHIRTLFAKTDMAKEKGWDLDRFSYNVGDGRCEECGGSGFLKLDIQYLPEMDLTCPTCGGKRYNPETLAVTWEGYSIDQILALSLSKAKDVFTRQSEIIDKLNALEALGLGYLTLGEPTPSLSGGESQRLKLVSEMGRLQKGTLYLFDEPTTGLHPQDIRALIHVLDTLLQNEATIILIEHDLDLIANADYVIDMGPGGGVHGGQVVASGTSFEIRSNANSFTGRYLNEHLNHYGK